MILDNIGKITSGILVAIMLYFWFFKKDALKNYWKEKNAEIEAKINQKYQ